MKKIIIIILAITLFSSICLAEKPSFNEPNTTKPAINKPPGYWATVMLEYEQELKRKAHANQLKKLKIILNQIEQLEEYLKLDELPKNN